MNKSVQWELLKAKPSLFRNIEAKEAYNYQLITINAKNSFLIFQNVTAEFLPKFSANLFRLLPIIIFQNNDYIMCSMFLKFRIQCRKGQIYHNYLLILPIIMLTFEKFIITDRWYQWKIKRKEKLSKMYLIFCLYYSSDL